MSEPHSSLRVDGVHSFPVVPGHGPIADRDAFLSFHNMLCTVEGPCSTPDSGGLVRHGYPGRRTDC
jgi:hypothetical protein